MKKKILAILTALLLTGCSSLENAETVQPPSQTDITTQAATVTELSEIETMPPETTEEIPEVKPKETHTISFCAVGDNLIHSPIYRQAQKAEGYDFSAAYSGVKDIIENADLAVINQETLICNDMYEPSNYPRFNSPAALGDYMTELGFDVFTLANNHCLDYGEEGLSYSLDYWESRKALTAGVYRNEEDKSHIRTGEFGGITFSFLSYTESLNGLYLPSTSEMVIGDVNDLEGMLADIRAAKEISDVCVVALHWGVEGSGIIEEWQREYAAKLAEAGADIIIGNHPHVLRDIEMIEREGNDAVCAYSLGNFISAQNVGTNLISGILEFNVTYTEGDSTPVISDVRLTPIVTHYDNGYANLRLYKLSDYTPELAAAHGVHSYSSFGYDFIVEKLKGAVDERFLDFE